MKYNHMFSIAYIVISESPDSATNAEHLAALKARVAKIEADENEQTEAFQNSSPDDTYAIEE